MLLVYRALSDCRLRADHDSHDMLASIPEDPVLWGGDGGGLSIPKLNLSIAQIRVWDTRGLGKIFRLARRDPAVFRLAGGRYTTGAMRWTVVLAALLFGLTVACSDDSGKSAQPTSLPAETVGPGEDALPSPVSTEIVSPEQGIQARPVDIETLPISAHDAPQSSLLMSVRFEPTPGPEAEITVEILEQGSKEVLATLTRDSGRRFCLPSSGTELFSVRGYEAQSLLSTKIFVPGPNPYQVRVIIQERGATQVFTLDLPSPTCFMTE